MIPLSLPQRKLPRLKGYDYSQPGVYFITICTHQKECVFGTVIPGDGITEARLVLTPLGEIAKTCLLRIEALYNNAKIHNWVVMPNHVHILLEMMPCVAPAQDVVSIIGQYKAAVTRVARAASILDGKLWQVSYHDHVIRGSADYRKIWQYIHDNPAKWHTDCFYTI